MTCTCCHSCVESRLAPGAQVYGTCVTDSFSVAAKARRKVKSHVTYAVRVKPSALSTLPYTLRVALPAGTIYVEDRATGLNTAPTVTISDGTTLVTWASVNPKKSGTSKPMARTFFVRMRIDNVIAKGTVLTLASTLFQANQVTMNGTVCGRAVNDVMVRRDVG